MPIATRRIRIGRFLMMLCISIAILAYGWFRSPSPRWIVGSANEFRNAVGMDEFHTVLGFGSQGELLTTHNVPHETVRRGTPGTPPRRNSYRSDFVIRDPGSGRELRRFPIPDIYVGNRALMPDGLHVLLQSDHRNDTPSIAVFNVSDGAITHHLDEYTTERHYNFSPNGRYLDVMNKDGDHFIYDFVEKKVRFPVRNPLFSADNKRWAMEDSSGDNIKLRFYSLETGQELGSVVLPYTWQTILTYKSWVGDRIEFWMQEANSTLSALYSCNVRNYVLSELRREPDWRGAFDRSAESKIEYQRNEHWAGVTRSVPTDNFLVGIWNSVNDFLGLNRRVNPFQISAQTWQQFDPQTGRPVSRPLKVNSGYLNVSPDGRLLLLTSGQGIQCWDLPLRSYLPIAIMVVIGQWIVLWRSRWLIRQHVLP
jgi:hypothetical protein